MFLRAKVEVPNLGDFGDTNIEGARAVRQATTPRSKATRRYYDGRPQGSVESASIDDLR